MNQNSFITKEESLTESLSCPVVPLGNKLVVLEVLPQIKLGDVEVGTPNLGEPSNKKNPIFRVIAVGDKAKGSFFEKLLNFFGADYGYKVGDLVVCRGDFPALYYNNREYLIVNTVIDSLGKIDEEKVKYWN